MSDVFEDVEEGMRRESIERLTRKYGPIALGVVIIAILGAVAFVFFQNWRNDQREKAAEAFIVAQNARAEGEGQGALTELDRFAASAPGGYAALAAMERAGALQTQGDLDGAIAALESAISLADDPLLKETAQLRAAYLAAETQNLTAIEARLSDIIEARGPLSYLARELVGAEAFESGDFARARTEFGYLQAAPDAPAELKERAGRFLAVIPTEQSPLVEPSAAAPESVKTGEKQ